MLLSLAFLGFWATPLIIVLVYTSQASTATQVARGASASAAYSGLSRSIDMQQTLVKDQPQLHILGTPDLAAAEVENQAAVDSMWRYSNISSILGAGVTAQVEDLPDWDGYSRASSSARPRSLATVNVGKSPDSAASDPLVKFSCKSAQGFKRNASTGIGETLCWVDHRAVNNSSPPQFTRSQISDETWDHYSSGVETQVRLEVPALFLQEEPFRPLFRSSASFAQPCLGGNCAQ